MKIVNVTPENARKETFFCIKTLKEPGFEAKASWFKKRMVEGLKIKVVYADDGKQVGFIEYVPAEYAWRPVEANKWIFIQCIMVYPNKYRSTGGASMLIDEAIKDARDMGKFGVCTMTSHGAWVANKKVFVKKGFDQYDKSGRFELMALKLDEKAPDPHLSDWEMRLPEFEGWQLFYADQCPWHDKGVKAMVETAKEKGIDLKVKKIESAEEARQVPSGFGVFALVKDGKLLEDHYLSKRRFETIIKKELK